MAFGKTEEVEELLEELAGMSRQETNEVSEDRAERGKDIDEGHLTSYLDECVKESYESSKQRREIDEKLWEAHETELEDFADKEDWQSKIVLNKPFTSTLQAKALVRRGLNRPDYFSLSSNRIDDKEMEIKIRFWEKALKYWTRTREANLPYVFADSAEMGFAVGQSMSIKISFEKGAGDTRRLHYNLFEPWKTYPDPDRLPRKPWSGLYNIHEEWVDFHDLKQKEKEGYYQNVDQVRTGKNVTDGAGMGIEDREEERRRKGQNLHRNKYRKAVLVREFWGTILDHNGDVLMEKATFTSANGVILRKPRVNKYKRLMWPWVDFSPITHLVRFHGYGLYEGALSTWKFQNALMNLYIDNENWRINNMFEVFPHRLSDPSDVEAAPGKIFLRTKRSEQDGPAIVPVLKNQSNLSDVAFMWHMVGELWDKGTMIPPVMKGESPGRNNVTAEEIRTTRDTASGIFDSIGQDIEQGGTDIMWATKEILTHMWDNLDDKQFPEIFGEDQEIYEMMANLQGVEPEERMETMSVDSEIKVEGVSRMFKEDAETQKTMEMIEIGNMPQFVEFMNHQKNIQKIAKDKDREEMIKTEEEINQERMAAEQAQKAEGVDSAVGSALEMADKSMGVFPDQPGSTQQQQASARGNANAKQ